MAISELPRARLGDLEVAAQGLGCMGMSQSYGHRGDRSEAIATIRRGLDLGVELIDTANVYGEGENERLVGEAIAGRREDVLLATKFGVVRTPDGNAARGDPAYVKRCCDASLSRLGVDHIDLYYQHRVDPKVPVEETWAAMSELVASGKVRFLGISEATPATIRRAHAVHSISALQSEWSLWSRELETEVVPLCRDLGIGIVPYAPLGRGFLTGTVTTLDGLPKDDMRRRLPRFSVDHLDRNLEIAKKLSQLADARGVRPAQLALAWLHHQGDDVVPIPGTKRRSYLEENLGAAALKLSAAEVAALERAAGEVAGERYPEEMSRTNQVETPPQQQRRPTRRRTMETEPESDTTAAEDVSRRTAMEAPSNSPLPVGEFGVWTLEYDLEGAGGEAAALAEKLGFGAFWLGGSPRLPDLRRALEATDRIQVATSVVNIWSYAPEELAADWQQLESDFPGRTIVGIGVGHPQVDRDSYARPLSAMRDYLDRLDAAESPGAERRCLAALGPKMLELAGARSAGSIPYFVPPEHTRIARQELGLGPFLAPELSCVYDEDPERARSRAQRFAKCYLPMTNYANAIHRSGFSKADLEGEGSERLLDAVVPHGGADKIAAVARAHLEAGANHVAIQSARVKGVPEAEWTAVANALISR
jgi:probable F420-dependent oxidoreductase